MPKKLYQFFINGLIYDKYVTFSFFISFLRTTKPLKVKEFSDNELLDKIATGKSLIRYGDGESMLMTGRDIHYQKSSPTLAKDLRKIIDNYSTDSPYIIGVMVDVLRQSEEELRAENKLRVWRLFRTLFKLRFSTNPKYYSAVYFYHLGNFENKVAPLLKTRHVICVANPTVLNTTLQQYLSNNFKTADFVFAPPSDAYFEKAKLMGEIDSCLGKYPASNCTILLAAGPASKIVAHEYALRGIQAIDIGHGMEIIGRDIDYSDRV